MNKDIERINAHLDKRIQQYRNRVKNSFYIVKKDLEAHGHKHSQMYND